MSEKIDKAFGGLLSPAHILRKQGKRIARGERKRRRKNGIIWSVYGNDIEAYFTATEKFVGSPTLDQAHPWLQGALKDRIERAHESGVKALYLDICGDTDGQGMEFDGTVSFALSCSPSTAKKTSVEGNVFFKGHRIELAKTMDSTEGEFIFGVMNPVHGFYHGKVGKFFRSHPNSPEFRYVSLALQDLFEETYERFSESGFIAANTGYICQSTEMETDFFTMLRSREIPFTHEPESGWTVLWKDKSFRPPREDAGGKNAS